MVDFYIAFLRKAIEVAARARQEGNHPFGAVLVGPDEEILLEAGNTVISGEDITGHAELNLARMACRVYERKFLRECTLYASTEPCPMCAGAIYWSGIGRVVFGLGEVRLYQLPGLNSTDDVLRLSCKDVLARGGRFVEVLGPFLEDEAEKVHEGFWML